MKLGIGFAVRVHDKPSFVWGRRLGGRGREAVFVVNSRNRAAGAALGRRGGGPTQKKKAQGRLESLPHTRLGYHKRTLSFGPRYSFSPGFTSKAWYH